MTGALLPISTEHPDAQAPGVVTVTLEQPGRPVVVLDRALIERLDATLSEVPESATGLILASASERVFVAGADLKEIQDADDEQLHRYLEFGARVFMRLAEMPFPTVAAINGASLGGGLELAMHCDGLVAAPGVKPYPVGLPEAGLNICPGWGGTQMLPARVDPATAIAATASGKPMLFDDARDAGLFDAVAESQDGLMDAARAWLAQAGRPDRDGAPSRWIGRTGSTTLAGLDGVRRDLPDTKAARAVAACVDEGLSGGWQAGCKAERDRLVALRHSPEALDSIAAFFERSKK
ncbi:MAG: enoyl-CoA hydratase/isomerase family protein [Planctomycetota bacterium]